MQDREKAALVLFSGGQDSTTCLAWALDRFSEVETIGFDYGQRHAVELEVRPDVRIPMLISAGTAVFPHDGASYEALLAKADSRMYRDKSQRKAARAQLRSTEPGAEAPPASRNRAAI